MLRLVLNSFFLWGFFLIIAIGSFNLILNQNELNIAIASGIVGVNEGILVDSSAIYPKETFNEYELSKPFLIHPNSIKIVKINYKNLGFDSSYNKKRVQLKVFVTSENIKNKKDQDSAGDRINYNLRKSIAYSFNTTNMSNSLYNPCFSNNYVFTTANVVWI